MGRGRKARPNLTNFFSTLPPRGTPTRRHALGRLPTPPPLPENLLLRLHRKLPSAPPASTQEVRNPKIGQQLGAQRILMGGYFTRLWDAGYQKFLLTNDGRKFPALAEQLGNLHRFNEELLTALAVPAYYNEVPGSTFSH